MEFVFGSSNLVPYLFVDITDELLNLAKGALFLLPAGEPGAESNPRDGGGDDGPDPAEPAAYQAARRLGHHQE